MLFGDKNFTKLDLDIQEEIQLKWRRTNKTFFSQRKVFIMLFKTLTNTKKVVKLIVGKSKNALVTFLELDRRGTMKITWKHEAIYSMDSTKWRNRMIK